MTKILLTGCNGRMGKVITELASADPEVCIIAGVDVAGTCMGSYPVYAGFDEVKEKPDVIVDFSSPKALDAMMDYALFRPACLRSRSSGSARMQRRLPSFAPPTCLLASTSF